MSKTLPLWLTQADPIIGSQGHDSWIRRNLNILGRIGQGFVVPRRASRSCIHPALQLLGLLALVLIISLLRQPLPLAGLGLMVMLRIVFLPRAMLAPVLATAGVAGLFSLLLWLPSAWLWPGSGLWLLAPAKIFLSVAAVAIFAQYNGRWELGQALRGLRVPAPLILIVDQTLYYIVIMARLGRNLFLSLEKRTVGWDRQPRAALSGIAGTTFLRSWSRARLTIQAMECRCFDGSFRPLKDGAE